MASKIEGLATLQANFEKLASQSVPKCVAKSINKVVRNAIKNGTKAVSKDVKAPIKLIKKRVQLTKKATLREPVAKIRANRGNLPLIRLLESSRYRINIGLGQVKIGQHRVQRGFIQTLSNGRKQVMQRRGKSRYSIDVVKIPLAIPLANAFNRELKNYSNQVKVELSKELSSVFRK